MKQFPLILFTVFLVFSCKKLPVTSEKKEPVLEVAGKFLYKNEIDKIIPTGSSIIDSADIADRYIQKWVTDVLMYDNARRNINHTSEIDALVEEYRKSLIIHAYEEALVVQRVETKVSEEDIAAFYQKYKHRLQLEENIIQGMLLIVPKDAPQLNEVNQWLRDADTKSLESLEKYSLQNAISFDYFNEWTPLSEILRRAPFVVEDSKDFVLNTRFTETADSTRLYYLRITKAIPSGETEPYEMAKKHIPNTIINKKKADFIIEFEKSIYNDALRNGEINFIKKK
ncbi:MAG: hypothetical protein ACK5KP_06690 [Paludibacteraceae bacterium]